MKRQRSRAAKAGVSICPRTPWVTNRSPTASGSLEMKRNASIKWAAIAAVAALWVAGAAVAGEGVEIEFLADTPVAGSSGLLVARAEVQPKGTVQASGEQIDQHPDPGSGGSGGAGDSGTSGNG